MEMIIQFDCRHDGLYRFDGCLFSSTAMISFPEYFTFQQVHQRIIDFIDAVECPVVVWSDGFPLEFRHLPDWVFRLFDEMQAGRIALNGVFSLIYNISQKGGVAWT